MPRLWYFGGPQDNATLLAFVESLGAHVLPFRLGSKPAQFGGCITYEQPSQLHPAGPDGRQLYTVRDPIVEWHPSYCTTFKGDNYIIKGHFEYAFEVSSGRDAEAARGKKLWGAIARWVKSTFPPRQARAPAFGPEAKKLVQFQGYLARDLPPTITLETVPLKGKQLGP